MKRRKSILSGLLVLTLIFSLFSNVLSAQSTYQVADPNAYDDHETYQNTLEEQKTNFDIDINKREFLNVKSTCVNELDIDPNGDGTTYMKYFNTGTQNERLPFEPRSWRETCWRNEGFNTKQVENQVYIFEVDYPYADCDTPVRPFGQLMEMRGFLVPQKSGVYQLGALVDDGIIWDIVINGEYVNLVDSWRMQSNYELLSQPVTLEQGKIYPIRIQYAENKYDCAWFQLIMKLNGGCTQIMPSSYFYPYKEIEAVEPVVNYQVDGKYDAQHVSVTGIKKDPEGYPAGTKDIVVDARSTYTYTTITGMRIYKFTGESGATSTSTSEQPSGYTLIETVNNTNGEWKYIIGEINANYFIAVDSVTNTPVETSSYNNTPTQSTVQYTLSVSSTEGGSVGFEGTRSYDKGTTVKLELKADEGYSFSNWTGDTSAIGQDNVVTMNANVTLVAHFEPIVSQVEEAVINEIDVPESAPVVLVEEVTEKEVVQDNVSALQAVVEQQLPQTGGVPSECFYLVGAVVAVSGVMIRKKRK